MKERNQKTMAKATFGTIALATVLIILFIANPILTTYYLHRVVYHSYCCFDFLNAKTVV